MIILYRTIWVVFSPLLDIWFIFRLIKGKEDKKRWRERLGKASKPRPNGKLIWIHCASVGESMSTLPLVDTLLETKPHLNILITTGTVTSAKIMARRLPQQVIHQYVPLDFYLSVKMFMNHWKPNLSIFVESELWPEMVTQAPNPMLINARVSDRSAKRYSKLKSLTGKMFSRFVAALAQTEEDTNRLQSMGIQVAQTSGNIKFDAPPLEADETLLKKFKETCQNKAIWVCASTHSPEEAQFAAMHLEMQSRIPNLLTVIIPRHPHRGKEISHLLSELDLNIRCRGKNEFPDEKTQIYLADSIGEMGLFYQLADIVTIGGSFVEHGGQNPLEPLKLGKVTTTGPHMHNFRKMMQMLLKKGIVQQSTDLQKLEKTILAHLGDEKTREQAELYIQKNMHGLEGATAFTAQEILKQLENR